jgi:type VI secretion system secreted protein VgrG
VVGKKGEEIWTDEHGRVKVQFHWDRDGKEDENSSCWIRVAQVWAGKKWGGIALPRIGQEVIVHFIGGDPDQPIVTGRVYNGDNRVPYELPAKQTQSGIKSRSTKSGTEQNFNELRFEDKKGEEQIYFHAEKDFERFVENDDKLTVDEGNQTIEFKQGDRTATLNMGSDSLLIKQGNLTTKLDLGKSTTEAMQSIELKVGQNSVKIDQSGVTIKGVMVKIEGSAMSEMKAPMTTIKGDGMLTAKGGVTMIN